MESDSPDEANGAIQGGEVATGDPAVGLLRSSSGSYCTGTLIAPNVVLTAAHCVKKKVEGFYTTRPGSAVATVRHEVSDQDAAPWYIDLWCPNLTHDIAVVRLANRITDIQPLPFGGSLREGQTCRTVGFGRHTTDDGDIERERKRTAYSRVTSVDGDTIKVQAASGPAGGLADSGDSGGPLFCDGKIVATVACHSDDDDNHRTEYYEKLNTGWIQDKVEDWR